MKKIFTLGCGLLLMSALAVNEAKAAYLPQSTWIYLENDYEEEIADPVEVELTMNSEGEYTIPNFLNSWSPFSFTFEKPAIGETSAITITSNHSSLETSSYLLDEDDDYLYCWIKNLNGEKGWFMLYAPLIYLNKSYSYVYRIDKEKYGYDYCVNLYFSGDAYAEEDDEFENPIELGWNNLVFYFNEPEQVEYPETSEFPKTIDYTINGEKKLAGVDVNIDLDDFFGPTISVNGESDAETIALTLDVPEGWDGWIISAAWAEVSEQPMVKTRSEEDWLPLEFYLNNEGYQKGNTVTFAVEDESNWATLALYKDNWVYKTKIYVDYYVKPAGGVVEKDPVFPESIVSTVFTEGLIVDHNDEDGEIFISVTGEIKEETFDVVLEVPEGWTGFISMPVETDDVIISEFNPGPRMAKVQEAEWMPIEDVMDEGVFKGNKFTFKANGTRQQVEVHLYKDDMVDVANFITLTANVTQTPNVEFPKSFDITYNGQASLDLIEATQGEDESGVFTINVSGISLEDKVTVALEVPAGWDGFVCMNEDDFSSDINPLTRAYESEWVPVDMLLEYGFKESNKLTFAVDGEVHRGSFYLVKDGEADEANQIQVEFNVSNPTTGVSGVDAIDSNARYYDINGRQIAKPAAGMYIKVLNGKASKVIVK